MVVRLAFGHYELDTALYELRRDGERCHLEPQAFNVLAYLAAHRDRIVSRQELFDALWVGRIVTDATLSSRIKAARKAVGDNGHVQSCIATIHCRGYRFVAEAHICQQPGSPLGVAAERHTPSQNDAITGRRSTDRPLLPLELDFDPDRPAIAVLPFAHNHGDDNAAWIAEVLAADIGIQLARIPGFVLVSRNSTAVYRGREVGTRQLRAELGVHYIVEGSAWTRDDHLRLSFQLIETTEGRVLWADRMDCSDDHVDSLEDDIPRRIVSHIQSALDRAEFARLRKRRPIDLSAWALYRQGHATLGLMGWSEQSLSACVNLMRQAIARDPALAFAHAYLALVLSTGHLVGLLVTPGCHEEALAAAERAIALDSQDSDVLGYVGCAFADLGEHHRGIGILRRALELDPSNAQAHAALGAALLQRGDAAGVEEMQQGIRISPCDNRRAVWGALMARGLLDFGRILEAVEVAENACRCDDKLFLSRIVLAIAHGLNGQRGAARTAIDDARRIRPGLNRADLERFARPEEIVRLARLGLFARTAK